MNNLKTARKSNNLKQKVVAKHLNIAPATYSRYETGVIKPSPEVLVQLSGLFGVSVDYLLGAGDYANDLCVKEDISYYGTSIKLNNILSDDEQAVEWKGNKLSVLDKKIIFALITAYQETKEWVIIRFKVNCK